MRNSDITKSDSVNARPEHCASTTRPKVKAPPEDWSTINLDQDQTVSSLAQPFCSAPAFRQTHRQFRMSHGWSGPGGAVNYAPHTTLSLYKKQAQEVEDSSSVVSSTQDIEPTNARYLLPGEITRVYCDETTHRVRQDHFGSLIGMLSELQDSNCPEIDQILAEGSYSEIKTETPLETLHIHQQHNQTDVGFLSHQDLYPSSYLRQNCSSTDPAYSNCRDEHILQYPTQLHLKGGYDSVSPSELKGGPYSPLSPGSPSVKNERSRDDKYWERRRKNNLAAKKSRDARRVRENQLRLRVLCSENQIRVLRGQLDRSQEENQILRERLKKYEGDVHISSLENYTLVGDGSSYDDRAVNETEYQLAGNSNSGNEQKMMEDDLNKR